MTKKLEEVPGLRIVDTEDNLVEGMALMEVMGAEGDSKYTWDPANPDEVEAARTHFNALKKKGYVGFRVLNRDGGKGEEMKEFDQAAGGIIMAPQIRGGR